MIHTIVSEGFNVDETMDYIKWWLERNMAVTDQKHFQAVVESELLNLHEGNIARFRLIPDLFQRWKSRS